MVGSIEIQSSLQQIKSYIIAFSQQESCIVAKIVCTVWFCVYSFLVVFFCSVVVFRDLLKEDSIVAQTTCIVGSIL